MCCVYAQEAPSSTFSKNLAPVWEAFAKEMEHTLGGSTRVAVVRETHVYFGVPMMIVPVRCTMPRRLARTSCHEGMQSRSRYFAVDTRRTELLQNSSAKRSRCGQQQCAESRDGWIWVEAGFTHSSSVLHQVPRQIYFRNDHPSLHSQFPRVSPTVFPSK